jgi:sugar phosphate isomerase/epimerase
MRLAVQENLVPGRTLAEKFEFAAAAGFDGIELLGDSSFAGRVEELRAARAAGVVMPVVCLQGDPASGFIGDFDAARRRWARERMKDLLSVIVEAGGFGAITPAAYGMFSRKLPPFTPPRDAAGDLAVLTDALAELGSHAAAVGAVLLLEPLNRYVDHMINTLADGAALVERVGLDTVRLVGDFFHMNIEEADLHQTLRQTAGNVDHIHLADSNRKLPGQGHMPYPEYFRTLREINFEGAAALECGINGDPREELPRCRERMAGWIGAAGEGQ